MRAHTNPLHPDNFINRPVDISADSIIEFYAQFGKTNEDSFKEILKYLSISDMNNLAMTSRASYAYVNNWRRKLPIRIVNVKRKITTLDLNAVYGGGGLPSVHRSATKIAWKDPEVEKREKIRGRLFFRLVQMNFSSLKEIVLQSPYIGSENGGANSDAFRGGPHYLNGLHYLEVLKKLTVTCETRRFVKDDNLGIMFLNILRSASLEEVKIKIGECKLLYQFVPPPMWNKSIKKLEIISESEDCPFNFFIEKLEALNELKYQAKGMSELGLIQLFINFANLNKELHTLTLGRFTKLPSVRVTSLRNLTLEVGDIVTGETGQQDRITSFFRINPNVEKIKFVRGMPWCTGPPGVKRHLFGELLQAVSRYYDPRIELEGDYHFIQECAIVFNIQRRAVGMNSMGLFKRLAVRATVILFDQEKTFYQDEGDFDDVWRRWYAEAWELYREEVTSRPDDTPGSLREPEENVSNDENPESDEEDE